MGNFNIIKGAYTMVRTLLFIAIFSLSLHASVIKFAPLPMYKSELVIKQYQQMLDYLHEQTGLEFEFVYHADYAQQLRAIVDQEVDIAHLGPLPYAQLLLMDESSQKPVVQFLDSKGKATYTCSFITLKQNVDTKDLVAFEPIALTQPLSTCGFLSVSQILEKYDLDLAELDYYYSGTHSHVVLDILLGDAKSGGVRTSEYLSYKHLGLTQIDQSQSHPGFLLVAAASLDSEIFNKIQNLLTALDPFHDLQDAKMMQDWGTNVKYGSIKADASCYEQIKQSLKKLDILEIR